MTQRSSPQKFISIMHWLIYGTHINTYVHFVSQHFSLLKTICHFWEHIFTFYSFFFCFHVCLVFFLSPNLYSEQTVCFIVTVLIYVCPRDDSYQGPKFFFLVIRKKLKSVYPPGRSFLLCYFKLLDNFCQHAL